MTINIPELSLVVLIGPSGSGKSTFARTHLKPTEVLSSDYCRGLVSDDENDQTATRDAFEVLHFIARKRLAAGKLTAVDATNTQVEARKPLVALAREYHVIPVAIVFNFQAKFCEERNRHRADRNFGQHVIRSQVQQLRRSIRGLQREGFRHVYIFSSPEEVDTVTLKRQPLWNNLRHVHGPFDVIGDVHGCFDELKELLEKLGYSINGERAIPPEGRKAVFVGDLVDRGPKVVQVLRLAIKMVEQGTAFCVPGNHDVKLMRKLKGRDVQITHGLAESMAQLEGEPDEFKNQVATFLNSLVSHYVFDDGRLVVAHAGLREELQGRGSAKVRDFALYGETTGETDEFGLPVRYNWAADYRGKATVVYGHTPIPEPEWLNRTINIDTGCVFGGSLTAFRYPEKELIFVPAREVYYQPARPLQPAATSETPDLSPQQLYDDLLDIDDVIGKRLVQTRMRGSITIREENAIAALEVMSRFAVNPKWLIYLPPTMSPPDTSRQQGLLEHPAEAFSYYLNEGVPRVICEEKHMGSRAVVVVCRDEEIAKKRFGIVGEGFGICYTRTGRRFFSDSQMESEFLAAVCSTLDASQIWEDLKTDWVCLDCELMPWSAKAQELLRQQYAPTGSAARAALGEAVTVLQMGVSTRTELQTLLHRANARLEMATQFVRAYQKYCWQVKTLKELRLAPFHLLASECSVHVDKPHMWHMKIASRLAETGKNPLIVTPFLEIDLTNEDSRRQGIEWWEKLTGEGGEGMVVKPLDFVTRGRRGIVQPAVKCRGREYLRIIYGPEYTTEENLERLRSRALGAKRSLAIREFALGIEALERFGRREPLRRVHECVFGVLALESEPVDPRL